MSEVKLEQLTALIGNDSHAASFQSLGQYRTALLKEIAQASAAPEQSANDIRLENCIIDVHGAIQTANGIEHENFTVKEVDGRAIVNLRGLLITERVRSCGCAAPEQEPVAWIDPVALDSAGPVYDAGFRDGCAESKRLNTHSDPSELERLRVQSATRQEAAEELARLLKSSGEEFRAATQRADAAERKLGEAVRLLQEVNDAWRALEGHDALFSAMEKVDALVTAGAEPAECTCPKIDEPWNPSKHGKDCAVHQPAKGGDGEVQS